jgi:Flp pilus assembly protein TadD
VFAGRAAQALEPLQRGLRFNPHDPQSFMWHQFLACAHLLNGEAEDAARHAGEAVDMRPESVSGQAILACSSAQLGRNEEANQAIGAMERALAASPNGLDELLIRFVNPSDRERFLKELEKAGWRRPQ